MRPFLLLIMLLILSSAITHAQINTIDSNRYYELKTLIEKESWSISYNPENLVAYTKRADYRFQLKDYEGSIKDLNVVLQTITADPILYSRRAYA